MRLACGELDILSLDLLPLAERNDLELRAQKVGTKGLWEESSYS